MVCAGHLDFLKSRNKKVVYTEISKMIKKFFPDYLQTGQWQLYIRGKLTYQLLKMKKTLGVEIKIVH